MILPTRIFSPLLTKAEASEARSSDTMERRYEQCRIELVLRNLKGLVTMSVAVK